MEMFYPKPGDTIVCRNGQRFICVSEEDYAYNNHHPAKAIYGYHSVYGIGSHMNWPSHDGMVNNRGAHGYDIVKIEPVVEPKDKIVHKQYKVTDIIAALDALEVQHTGEQDLSEMLEKVIDPDYPKYLELKKKFEGEHYD